MSTIRYDLNGSIHENEAAIPPIPASMENTGVMQHREAIIAERKPAPALLEVEVEVFKVLFFPGSIRLNLLIQV